MRVEGNTMNRMSIVSLMCAVLLALGCQQELVQSSYAAFGAPIQTSKAVSLARAVEKVEAYRGKPVCVKASVGDVCAKMGCWMMLTDGDRKVRVRFTASEQCADGATRLCRKSRLASASLG